MTNEEYSEYVKEKEKTSPIVKDCLIAFLVGGLICIIGQLIFDIFEKQYGFSFKNASTYTTISLIFIGALLTALRVYSKIGDKAGAGSIIPITGFSNSIVSSAIEHKTEGVVMGIGANMFKVAGPVLVYGVCSSMFIGFIYWLIKLF
ncbi:MAG: stage V sporulation protein AC [Clostridia bacterium]|nr:stage V sporulation protein AC [Clostridia bacterium]